MEIERKFLVRDISNLKLEKYKSKKIIQAYLYKDIFTAIRKRKIIDGENNKFYYTIKTKGDAFYSANEIESEISEEEYNKLEVIKNTNIIEKTRYYIPIENDLVVELDVFDGIFKEIVFAEIEFKTEQEAANFKPLEWFDKELTKKVNNSIMALHNKEYILNLIG